MVLIAVNACLYFTAFSRFCQHNRENMQKSGDFHGFELSFARKDPIQEGFFGYGFAFKFFGSVFISVGTARPTFARPTRLEITNCDFKLGRDAACQT